ncbi:MAG TPA: hypothetical protein VEA37_12155, partial [Flavobacterium sp.]|nr:hypothetical protein [Flavobacterium sp.]
MSYLPHPNFLTPEIKQLYFTKSPQPTESIFRRVDVWASAIVLDWKASRPARVTKPVAVVAAPKPAYKSTEKTSWIRGVVLGFVFVFAVGVAAFGYPVADAAYRLYKLYPLISDAKTSINSGNLKELYPEIKAAQYQLKALNKDMNALAPLRNLPLIGSKVQSARYLVRGSQKTVDVFVPVVHSVSQANNLSELGPDQRKQIINHLAAQSNDLKIAALMLKRGESSLMPHQVRDGIHAIDKLAYIAPELPELLGVNAPKRYLIIFANNMEIRPAGGFVGS